MDPLDFIRDLFSRDCSMETVLHLVMGEFDLTQEEAQKKIDDYFEIIEAIDRERQSKNQQP